MSPVLFVADLFHPLDILAVHRFLNGDMRHRGRGRRPVPVLLPGRKPVVPLGVRKGTRELKVRVEGQLVFNGTFQMLNAALAGFGLAYVPENVAQPHLAKRRLMRVLED
jgi:DNA-binding transcriptional LysR family regulator